jgi:hypothetical protein
MTNINFPTDHELAEFRICRLRKIFRARYDREPSSQVEWEAWLCSEKTRIAIELLDDLGWSDRAVEIIIGVYDRGDKDALVFLKTFGARPDAREPPSARPDDR